MVNPNPSVRPTVLIVDDDNGIRKLLTTVLSENGYDTDACGTGQEAVAKTNERFYNMALIDIILPDMNGIELLTKIRETKPKMRKIIMTGNPSLQNAVEALNTGADAYIMKPLDVARMLITLEEQLKKQRAEREVAMEQFARGRLRGRIDLISREGRTSEI
jgi:DNA-binding NtrC family response regulator